MAFSSTAGSSAFHLRWCICGLAMVFVAASRMHAQESAAHVLQESAPHVFQPAAPIFQPLLEAMLNPPAAPAGGGNHAAGQGYLGVDLRDAAADGNGGKLRGAEIVRVDHDGPAGKAGLREHDVILSVNFIAVEGEQHLRRLLREMQPGRSVVLLISREGQHQTVNTTLTNRDELEKRAWEQHWVVPEPQGLSGQSTTAQDQPAPAAPSDFSPRPGFAHGFVSGHLLPSSAYTGVSVDAVGPQLAEFFGMKDGKGLLVHAVDANSPAATAGLHAGDVITRLNGKSVGTQHDWFKAMHDSKGHSVSITVMREHREQVLVMVPDSKHRSGVDPRNSADRPSPHSSIESLSLH